MSRRGDNDHASRLYLGNLPFDAGETEILEILAEAGVAPLGVELPLDRETGRPRGFAFVELGDGGAVVRATQALHGLDHMGRALVARPALPRRGRGASPSRNWTKRHGRRDRDARARGGW